MPIAYFTENVTLPKQFKKNLLKQWIKEIILNFGSKTGDITFIFCDNEKILSINQQYLHHDYYTDIITFDYTVGDIVTGELYISLEMVITNSEKFKTSYINEIYRVMIHGILHLCGIKDKTKNEKRCMTLEENKALELLNRRIELVRK